MTIQPKAVKIPVHSEENFVLWTKEEIDFLIANPSMSLIDIARALGRTESAVRGKRSRLKIRSGVSTNEQWTEEERRILKENYGRIARETLVTLLPSRTWDSIKSQVAYLRARKWKI